MLTVAEDALALATLLAAPSTTPTMQPVNLHSTLGEAVEMAASTQMSLRYPIRPAVCPDLDVLANSGSLRSTVFHLLRAADHAAQGGELTIEAKPDDAAVHVMLMVQSVESEPECEIRRSMHKDAPSLFWLLARAHSESIGALLTRVDAGDECWCAMLRLERPTQHAFSL